MIRLLLLLLLLPFVAEAQPSILNGTISSDPTHGNQYFAQAINAVLGSGKVDNPIFVDYAVNVNLVVASSNTTASYISVASGSTVNHAVYALINASLCCWIPSTDFNNYSTLEAQHTLYAQPIAVGKGGALPAGTAPPVTMITASSPNSADGGTSWGTEFSLSAGYLGLDTSEDSWVSAEITGLVTALEYSHPTWNPFDTKAALRITAANWATGYNAASFGYGAVDWPTANTATTLYLQPPGISVQNRITEAVISLYPYRQTRRVREVIYSVASGCSWAVKNEYALSDITACSGTLLYTSNGTDVTPTFTFVPVISGTVTLVAFTTDGSGAYSRVEAFSQKSVALTVGTACQP